MLKNQINQGFESFSDLIGKQVSFVNSLTVENNVYQEMIKGVVTEIVLSVSGQHSISVDGGDFFIFSDLLEFQLLD